MAYRYCPTCVVWLETAEYDVDPATGETICPDCERAVVGCIQPHRHFDPDVRLPRKDASQAKSQARKQGLLS